MALLQGTLPVVAVFDHAWHLRTPDGWIVTVTDAPWNGPLTICVGPGALRGLDVRVGTTARFTDDAVRLPLLSIDLTGGRQWRPWEGTDCNCSVTQERLAEAASSARLHIPRDLETIRERSRRASRGGIPAHVLAGRVVAGSGVERRGYDAAWSLARSCVHGDGARLREAVMALVGCGPGLTPSGDDLLCGFMAAWALLSSRLAGTEPRVPKALCDAVCEASTRTTSLSRTLLACASGQLPFSGTAGPPVVTEALHNVLWSVGTPTGVCGVDALLHIGHSSGSDMLAGVWLAAATLLEGGESDDRSVVAAAQRVL